MHLANSYSMYKTSPINWQKFGYFILMSLFIASLNSGSNGNCYYIGNEKEAILVDAGLSCRETEKRLKKCGFFPEMIKAIFVSHEHGDHISGISVVAKKYRLPVYITSRTQAHARLALDADITRTFTAHVPETIGDLRITAFPKMHDADDPHSFIIEGNQVTIGVFTDIGIACKNVRKYFSQCHAVFLEANYDDEMLENGGYPIHLKNRIRGGMGHLSNAQALELFLSCRQPQLQHLLLSHLSKNNNTPEKALNLFSPFAEGLHITVASRYQESAVYQINHTHSFNTPLKKPIVLKKKNEGQLSLF